MTLRIIGGGGETKEAQHTWQATRVPPPLLLVLWLPSMGSSSGSTMRRWEGFCFFHHGTAELVLLLLPLPLLLLLLLLLVVVVEWMLVSEALESAPRASDRQWWSSHGTKFGDSWEGGLDCDTPMDSGTACVQRRRRLLVGKNALQR